MPAFASMISGELCRVPRSFGIPRRVYYVDDLLIAADTAAECERQMQLAARVLGAIGLPTAVEKREGPAQVLDFLGVDIVGGGRSAQRQGLCVPMDARLEAA